MREALVESLAQEPDIEVVGDAADGLSALALARERSPDVILIDLQLPAMDGVEATRRILQEDPSVRIIGLSVYPKEIGEKCAGPGVSAQHSRDERELADN